PGARRGGGATLRAEPALEAGSGFENLGGELGEAAFWCGESAAEPRVADDGDDERSRRGEGEGGGDEGGGGGGAGEAGGGRRAAGARMTIEEAKYWQCAERLLRMKALRGSVSGAGVKERL